jgi:hypothetical protein
MPVAEVVVVTLVRLAQAGLVVVVRVRQPELVVTELLT